MVDGEGIPHLTPPTLRHLTSACTGLLTGLIPILPFPIGTRSISTGLGSHIHYQLRWGHSHRLEAPLAAWSLAAAKGDGEGKGSQMGGKAW